jgi:hypothetical protein
MLQENRYSINKVGVYWEALQLHLGLESGSNLGPNSGHPEVFIVFLGTS